MNRFQPPLPGFPSERELRGLDHTPPGAERLLAELAVRGLREEHLRSAAALVRALDHHARKEVTPLEPTHPRAAIHE